MPKLKTEICSLCGQTARVVVESAPGYQEGQTYTIYECESCFSSFVSPLAVEYSIYEHIYKKIKNVPGYNRYFRYAHEVKNQKHALDYLSRQEETYWAVAQHLRKRRSREGRLKILEVGCGSGYLTYALAQDGFTVTGVDISSHAIAWALEHYGPHFANITMQELKVQGQKYDAIIMTELIEHISDPHAFISEALTLLSFGGELILTTPNKSAHPGAQWETELPPVHLWWLGEMSMRYLAQSHNCTITFIDFEPYYRFFFKVKMPYTPIHSRKPFFDAQGKLLVSRTLPPVTTLRRMLDNNGILLLLRGIRTVASGKERWRGTRGPVCAAVLRHSKK